MHIAVVIVGDEVLNGSCQERNGNTLLAWARDQGHRVISVTVIGDTVAEIARACARARDDGAECLITTGGVGPTMDDRTIEGVATSLGLDDWHEDPTMIAALTAWIGSEPQGVRRRTATVPCGTGIDFPPSSRPGGRGWPVFVVGDTYCLPGIPRLVDSLLSLLPSGPGPMPHCVITFEGPETAAAEAVEALAAQTPWLELGSYPPTAPGDRTTRLTLRGGEQHALSAAADRLCEALRSLGLEPRKRTP
jgi:molybdenum cofactor synthesis domain-containing protein